MYNLLYWDLNFELKTALECSKRMYRLKPYQIFKAIDILMEGDKRLTKIMILLSFHFLPLRSFFNK